MMKQTLQFIKKESHNSSMKKSGLIFLMLMIFSITLVSAYDGHERYTDLGVAISSNNATSCEVTWFKQVDKVTTNLNINLDKDGTSFTGIINSGNFSQLGDICYGLSCTDGETSESGNECYKVTPSGKNGTSNIVFFVFMILLLYSLNLIAFFGKNIPITVLSGLALIFLGVYMINNGVIIYQDNLTNYLAYITIGVGTITALWAALEQFDII